MWKVPEAPPRTLQLIASIAQRIFEGHHSTEKHYLPDLHCSVVISGKTWPA